MCVLRGKLCNFGGRELDGFDILMIRSVCMCVCVRAFVVGLYMLRVKDSLLCGAR